MGNFFAEALLGILTIILILTLCAMSCKIIEIIWIGLYKLFSPCLCPGRHRDPWFMEIFYCIAYICDGIAYNCSICCFNFKVCIKSYKEKLKKKKKTVEPIIYDDIHIIVVNPFDKYQIATVSKPVN